MDEHRQKAPESERRAASPGSILPDDWTLFVGSLFALAAHLPLAAAAAHGDCGSFPVLMAAAVLTIAVPFAVGVRLVGRSTPRGRGIPMHRVAAAATLMFATLAVAGRTEMAPADRCPATAAEAARG